MLQVALPILLLATLGTQASTRCPSAKDDVVKIEDCKTDVFMSKLKRHEVTPVYLTKCKYDSISFELTIREFVVDDYAKGKIVKTGTDSLVLEPFTLNNGFYQTDVTAFAKIGDQTNERTGWCYIEVQPEVPVAIIDGGAERIVESGEDFTVDGSKSRNMDIPSQGPDNLVFEWSCSLDNDVVDDFCQGDFASSRTLTVPARFAIKDYVYMFMLRVKIKDGDDRDATTQRITIQDNAIVLKIACVRNCLRRDPQQETHLRATCLKHCTSEKLYVWTIEDLPDFDYVKNTKRGRNSDRFKIRAGVFEAGKKYKVSVGLGNNLRGGASQVIEFRSPPTIKSCTIEPPSGFALVDKFTLACDHSPQVVLFKIITRDVDHGFDNVVMTGPVLDEMSFYLPSDQEVYLKVLDVAGLSDIKRIDVSVNKRSMSTTVVSNHLKDITQLKSLKDEKQALSKLSVLINEVNSGEDRSVKMDILASLQNFSVKTPERAVEIATLTTQMTKNSRESDARVAQLASTICRSAAESYRQSIKLEVNRENMAEDAGRAAKSMMACSENDNRANFEALRPHTIQPPTTKFPPIDTLEVITENYADYIDDESVINRTSDYQQASRNFVNICTTNLETMALTMLEGDENGVKTAQSSIFVAIMEGEKLSDELLRIGSVSVVPSLDFRNNKVKDPIEARICTWKNDIFWWNSRREKVGTEIVLLEFHQDDTALTSFDNPVKLVLEINKTGLNYHNVSLNATKSLAVVRIDMSKGQSVVVEFLNLGDNSLKVGTSNFYKLTLGEVQSSGQVINQTQSSLFVDNSDNYDSWHYLSVLLETNMVTTRSYFLDTYCNSAKITTPLNFQVGSQYFTLSVYSASCFYFDLKEARWNFGCPGRLLGDEGKIECSCSHLSVLAGMITNSPIRVEEVNDLSDLVMVVPRCPTICLSLFVIFALYCIVLPCTIKRRRGLKGQDRGIYLLGDVSKNCRFEYILGVETGSFRSAGTTSSIGLRLFGDKSASEAHILNYPDPCHKLLQRGKNDCFVVTTRRSLGNLKLLEIWSDYTGYSPSWFCKTIAVHDVRSRGHWEFKVNSWLDLPPKGNVFVVVENVQVKSPKIAGTILQIKGGPQDGFSPFKRLTTMLSITTTIYAVTLILYGLPKLRLSDGFAYVDNFGPHGHVFWISATSALLTMVLHVMLLHLFRHKSQRVVICCWIVLAFNIVWTMSILTICGFWLPEITGWLWLTSTIGALLVYFLILSSVHTFVWKLLHKSVETVQVTMQRSEFRAIRRIVKIQKDYLFRKFGPSVLRRFLGHLYEPLDDYQIKERQLDQKQMLQIATLLQDIIMFLLYIILLYLAIYANKDPLTIRSNEQMQNLLAGIFTGGPSPEIQNLEEFYDYVESTIIAGTQTSTWYGEFVAPEPGLMIDFNNKYLGVVRIRQKRVKLHNCTLVTRTYCKRQFSPSEESKERFGPQHNPLDRLTTIWNHTREKTAGFSLTMGEFGSYYGDGYIASLGRTLYNSLVNLGYLRRKVWIDYSTAVIFIEFLTYNANVNLFNSVRVVFEISGSGLIASRSDVETSQFLFIREKDAIVEGVIVGAFLIVLVVFTAKIGWRLISRGWHFLVELKDLWLLVDLFIIALSYTCFALFLHRADKVKGFLLHLEQSDKNEFLNYFHIFHEDFIFVVTGALLVFLSTIRLWKLCRFASRFRGMELTISLSALSILSLMFCHMVVLIAFALTGQMLFGTKSVDFGNFGASLTTMALLSIGMKEDFDLEALSPVWGRLFYVVYELFGLLIVTLYVGVIMIYHYEAQVQLPSETDFTLIKRYLQRGFRHYATSVRFRGGALKKTQTVTPKDDDHRYADCMVLSTDKLRLMTHIALGVTKKSKMRANRKIELMARTVRCYFDAQKSDGDKNELFYQCKLGDNSIKLIHDDQFEMMANIAEALFVKYVSTKDQVERVRLLNTLKMQTRNLESDAEILTTILNIFHKININPSD